MSTGGTSERSADVGGQVLQFDPQRIRPLCQFLHPWMNLAQGLQGSDQQIELIQGRALLLTDHLLAFGQDLPDLGGMSQRSGFHVQVFILIGRDPGFAELIDLKLDKILLLLMSVLLFAKSGQSLARLLAQGRQAAQDLSYGYERLLNAVEILIKVCDALAFARSRGVLHCDLKAENIRKEN